MNINCQEPNINIFQNSSTSAWMWHFNSLTFETHVTVFMAVSSKISDISWIVIHSNSQFPGEPLKSGSWQTFWKSIVWSQGYDVGGHVWAGLSEALTFHLSLEKLTLKEWFFDDVGHHTWVFAKHDNQRSHKTWSVMIHERESGGTYQSVVEQREKVWHHPAQKGSWTYRRVETCVHCQFILL